MHHRLYATIILLANDFVLFLSYRVELSLYKFRRCVVITTYNNDIIDRKWNLKTIFIFNKYNIITLETDDLTSTSLA